jgi:hypothetical protein
MLEKEDYKDTEITVLTVALHKTARQYGPANVVVCPELQGLVKKMALLPDLCPTNEPQLRCDRGKNMFFRSSQGMSITSSDINR